MTYELLGIGFWMFLGALTLWSLFWKGLALWHAARLSHRKWFIAMLLLNTVGILDILYLYVFSKKNSRTSLDKNS